MSRSSEAVLGGRCRTPPTVDVGIPLDTDELYQQVRDELRIGTPLWALARVVLWLES